MWKGNNSICVARGLGGIKFMVGKVQYRVLTRMESLFRLAYLVFLRIHSCCPNVCYEHCKMDC